MNALEHLYVWDPGQNCIHVLVKLMLALPEHFFFTPRFLSGIRIAQSFLCSVL